MFQKQSFNTKKMKKYSIPPLLLTMIPISSCSSTQTVAESNKTPFVWEGANVYFLMTTVLIMVTLQMI
jgi:alpha-amylase